MRLLRPQDYNTEDAACCPEQAPQDEHAMTGDAVQYELLGKTQHFKSDAEAQLVHARSFAPTGLELAGDALHQGLNDKADDGYLWTERVSERRGEGSGDSLFAARGAQHLHRH